jgi:membrane-bound ClpP family serine protease
MIAGQRDGKEIKNQKIQEMDHKNLAFNKTNFILLAIGFVVVVIGFILMSGSGSTEEAYNPHIFDAVRIKVAPVVSLAGFLFMIFAVIYHKRDAADLANTEDKADADKSVAHVSAAASGKGAQKSGGKA